MKKIQAVILAGGKGTRLAPLTDNLPKPLVSVLGKPMILYVLEHLKRHGITRVAISVAHLGHMIEDLLGDGSSIGMDITYLREPEPMGTGGWAKLIDWDQVDDHFLVLNADNLFWVDIPSLLGRHLDASAVATIAAIEFPSEQVKNYELLIPSDDRQRLAMYVDRNESARFLEAAPAAFVSTGWYVMTPRVREFAPDVLPLSNEVHVWPNLAQGGVSLGFYHATEPWFDSGTHERLARVEAFLKDNPGYVA